VRRTDQHKKEAGDPREHERTVTAAHAGSICAEFGSEVVAYHISVDAQFDKLDFQSLSLRDKLEALSLKPGNCMIMTTQH
jgi:hypothetical protein